MNKTQPADTLWLEMALELLRAELKSAHQALDLKRTSKKEILRHQKICVDVLPVLTQALETPLTPAHRFSAETLVAKLKQVLVLMEKRFSNE